MKTFCFSGKKIHISIIIFFVIGFVVGGFVNIEQWIYGFDKSRYEESYKLFRKNEQEAMSIINNINLHDKEGSITGLENGKQLWLENIQIADNIFRIEGLPLNIKQDFVVLKKYCRLRLHYFSLFSKGMKEGDVKVYNSKLDSLNNEIGKIIKDSDGSFNS